MQASETLKILATGESAYAGKLALVCPWEGMMRTIKLRPRRPDCPVCGEDPTITSPVDYVRFCGSGKDKAFGNASTAGERITVEELHKSQYRTLIDVRPSVEFGICALADSVNVPFYPLMEGKSGVEEEIPTDTTKPVYLLCRAGINSQVAVQFLKVRYPEHTFKDVVGGLLSWSSEVDPEFPMY